MPWQKAKPLVGLERQIGSPCKQVSARAREGGRGISLSPLSELWPAQLPPASPASLQALKEQMAHPASGDVSADKEHMRGITENNICREVIYLLSHNHSMTELFTKTPHRAVFEQSYYCYHPIYFNFFFWEYWVFSCTLSSFLFKIASSWSAGVQSKHVDYIINHTQKPARGWMWKHTCNENFKWNTEK